MFLTKEQRDKIEVRFEEMRQLASRREEQLFSVLSSCNEEELICMKFLYGYMPLSDLANYDGDVYLQFVKHALKVRATVSWGNDIEPTMFLNYVLQYRINNENVEFYGETFFEQLYPRIQGKTMYEAAIEVNYWCFENATYQSTDGRTLSPFGTLKNAFGRCGEESVLTVAALRSVGIPARQCYTPRWAHCDDNHAWVEVYVDGVWKYLGACEPEIRLNTGWFQLPASRGMLIHNRVFSDLVENEIITNQNRHLTEVNITDHYAVTKTLEVTVVNPEGTPLEGVDVRFELINFAEFFPLARIATDEQGKARFVTGLGDLVVFAHNKEEYSYKKVDLRLTDEVQLVLGESIVKEEVVELELVPPVGGVNEVPLSKEEEELQKDKNKKAEAIRKAIEATFYQEESAMAYASQFGQYQEKVATFLQYARGNASEITRFLEGESTEEEFSYKVDLLDSLNRKDLSDITCDILTEHFEEAMPYATTMERELFVNYVLCPRITVEMIVNYRKAIVSHFTKEQIKSFQENPRTVLSYLEQHIESNNGLEYANLCSSAVGTLELGVASKLSMKIAVVSICRTIGIPCRVAKADGVIEFYQDGKWNLMSKPVAEGGFRSASLLLVKSGEEDFVYNKNYSVAVLVDGCYQNLDLEGLDWTDGTITYAVQPGVYRVMTANRQPDGTIESYLYFVSVADGEQKKVELSLKEQVVEKKQVVICDRNVTTELGEEVLLSELTKEPTNLVAWLDASAEPTEHLLNEMLELTESFCTKKPNVVFILRQEAERKDPTLCKVLKQIPGIQVVIDKTGFDSIDVIYDAFDIQSKRLPLALIVEENLCATFAMSGYHVGIGELLFKQL